MSKINEGQTQVYMNGGVTPQFGVNTSAPHLNNPPQQLIDIIRPLAASGKSDAQLLAILVGMGIDQQLAISGINACRLTSVVHENNKPQKNDKQMKFTLIDLYEKVNSAILALDEMASDGGRISYSAKMAKNELNETLKSFPNDLVLKLGEGSVVLSFNEGKELTEYKEQIEESINPSKKYNLMGDVYAVASKHSHISEMINLTSWIDQVYESNKWSFGVVYKLRAMSNKNDKLHEGLKNSLYSILGQPTEEIKESIKAIASKNPWSNEVSELVYAIKESDKEFNNQVGASPSRVITPFINEEDGTIVNINGENYKINENEVTKVTVSNQIYNNIIETLAMSSINGDKISFYGQRDKALVFDMNEGTLMLGGMNLSEKSVYEVRQALLTERFYHYAESNKVDKICMMLENIESITEMDNVLNLTSAEYAGLYLTMIAVKEGVYVNKINQGMNTNELVFYPSATEAITEAKSFIGYDASNYLSERLIAEGNERAIIEKKRSDINDRISFLQEKRNEVLEAIKSIGETEELTKAKELVEAEIKNSERELSETYSSLDEKKLSKIEIDKFADDGYVEATLTKTIDNDFKKGDTIMVNAEDYSSMGNGDLMKIINPSSGNNKLVDKKDLKISMD